MAAYAATPSHEKTYPSAAPPGTSQIERKEGLARFQKSSTATCQSMSFARARQSKAFYVFRFDPY